MGGDLYIELQDKISLLDSAVRALGNIGQKAFDEKYHLSWVKLDEKACEKLNWNK